MSRRTRSSAALLGGLVSLLGAACSSFEPMLSVPSAQAVRQLHAGTLRLIDTRSPDERRGNEIHGAALIPFGAARWSGPPDRVEQERFVAQVLGSGMRRDEPIATVCNASVRSRAAAGALRAAGFANVRSISGGYFGDSTDPGWHFNQ